jgi:uncharacterized protein with FMN-binding domain
VRRISYWVLSTISVLVLLIGFDASRHGGSVSTGSPPAVISSGPSTTSGTGSSSSNGSNGGTSSGTGTGNTTSRSSSGSARTTTVTGDTVQTQWGPVQVQLTIKGGTITGVKILQYPDGNPRDVEIASYALPILIRETTAGQSAQIDMVSGATFTSEGYVQSLQSALDRAGL